MRDSRTLCNIAWLGRGDNNKLTFYEQAQVYANIPDGTSLVNFYEGKGIIDIKARAQIGFTQGVQTNFFDTAKGFSKRNQNLTLQDFINDTASFADSHDNWAFNFTDFANDLDALIENRNAFASPESKTDADYTIKTTIAQYDMLISDASYKGINLRGGQNLKINFNEDHSSQIEVMGVKADRESLGLKTKEWKTAEDIEKSVSELEEAINSLSLGSQASQSILRLF